MLSSARPDRDDGEVGNRQNLWLEHTLERYKDRVKIVAIHHHIIPVPDTGADQITIVDAGRRVEKLGEVESKSGALWTPSQALEMEDGECACGACRQCFL